MKLSVELSEDDLRRAVAVWLTRRLGGRVATVTSLGVAASADGRITGARAELVFQPGAEDRLVPEATAESRRSRRAIKRPTSPIHEEVNPGSPGDLVVLDEAPGEPEDPPSELPDFDGQADDGDALPPMTEEDFAAAGMDLNNPEHRIAARARRRERVAARSGRPRNLQVT